MTKWKFYLGILFLCSNLSLAIFLYTIPYSSSEAFVLPKTLPKSVNHVVLFCGFVQCPTICPTSLRQISLAYNELRAEQIAEIQVVFVNLTKPLPKSATAQEYANGFHQQFEGWQLAENDQKQLIQDLHTYFLQGNERQATKHSPNIYLLNRIQNNQWHIAQIYTEYPAKVPSLLAAFSNAFDNQP